MEIISKEARRRSVVKGLLWRIIGILWTWIGAYVIMLLIPPSKKTAAVVATLIVAYHHSTRMIMYYFYERVWASINWGRDANIEPMKFREKLLWFFGVIITIALIMYLIIYITPLVKSKMA